MSNTYLHKEKGKYHKGKPMSTKLEKHFDRHNDDLGELRYEKLKLQEKILEKELQNILSEL